MKIYLLQGLAGTYDDYMHWPVKAFFKKEDAEAFGKKCQDEAKRIEKEIEDLKKQHQINTTFADIEDPMKYWDDYSAITRSNSIDPSYEHGQDCQYYIDEIEIEGELPQSETEN